MKHSPQTYLRIACILAVLWMAGCGSQPAKEQTTSEKPQKIQLTWYYSAGQKSLALIPAIVKAYNASQNEVELKLDAVHPSQGVNRLREMVANGVMPDILGPLDGGEYQALLDANRVMEDVEPMLVDELKGISPALLDMWRVDGKLIGVPVGIRPSILIYNKSLFDQAGVTYPPHSYSESYADGSEWNISKLEEIALLLTRDLKGNNPLAAEFDPQTIAQYGFTWHWMNGRGLVNIFGADPIVNQQGNASLPESWREGYRWYYSAIWENHFMPTGSYSSRAPFSSGNLGMMINNMWYLVNLKDVPFQWDLAAIPSFKGQATVDWLGGAMLISSSTPYPNEAVRAAYSLANSVDLLRIGGYIPAVENLQGDVLAALKNEYPSVDFQAALDGLNHLSQPSTVYPIPANMEAKFEDFRDRISTVEGLDLEAELDKLDAAIKAIP